MRNEDLYTDIRIVRTKRLLKTSLLYLLQDDDIKDISVIDIVERANINRKTFYNHYKNKEGLISEMIEDIVSDLVQSFREPYLKNKPFNVNRLSPLEVLIFESVFRHSKFYTIFLNSNGQIGHQFKNKLHKEIKRLYSLELRVENNLIAGYLAHATIGMIIDWVQSEFKYSPKYMAEQILGLMNTSPKQTFKINSYIEIGR